MNDVKFFLIGQNLNVACRCVGENHDVTKFQHFAIGYCLCCSQIALNQSMNSQDGITLLMI